MIPEPSSPPLESTPATVKRRALVFVNAKASQADGMYEQIAEFLTKGGLEVERAEAACAEDCAIRVRELSHRFDLMVAAGGDGTVVCAADAILEVTGGKLPLGIIPLGTANNVARSLGLPLTVEGACGVIIGGHTRTMDLGRVNGRLFVSVVGFGLSTQVHGQVPPEQKKRWGWLAYAWLALRLLLKKPPGFRAYIDLEDRTLKIRALQITVVNGRYYGARVEVHPEASLDDGFLDLSIIEADGYWKGLFKALLPLPSGHISHGLRLLRSAKFTIRTKRPMNIDVEGSTDLQTPAEFEVMPKALTVFAPRE